MLKVYIDQGKDYLEYLRPFILQVLVDHTPDPVTDEVVHDYLRTQFGLEIPPRTVQVVLKRLSQARLLRREDGVYHIAGVLPDPSIGLEKSKANRHIQAVVSGLLEFGKGSSKCIADEDEAVAAICGFLSEFNIPCLRAYLRGTTIPTVEGKRQAHTVLVSDYVLYLQQRDPERFESFMVLVQGHMLANALLCPDLRNAPKTYKGVTFYLDTPLLVQWLGLEGEPKKRAAEELIRLLRNLGAAVATFSHSREELDRVLRGAAEHIDSSEGRGAIIFEARRSGRTKSDVLLMAVQVDQLLADGGVDVTPTPRYTESFQIDETAFEKVLEDEINYFNPRARDYDINSVRSIYVLRGNTAPASVEKSRAMLVSSNTAFARAAYDYGRQFEASPEVSSVITDFGLANTAWLKAPMGAPSLPTTELLAYSYAALQPSKELLDKYMTEIDKLQRQGKLSVRDHQLLRSSIIGQEELVRLTLGDETALTEETVSETLRRVTSEIKEEESTRVKQEQESHRRTQEELEKVSRQRDLLQERIYWQCRLRAKVCAWVVSCVVAVFLLLGMAAGLGIRAQNPWVGWALLIGFAFLTAFSLVSLVFGTTLKGWHENLQKKCFARFLRKESKAAGIDLREDE
jgi:FtsZ-binding cell division protein ZapB